MPDPNDGDQAARLREELGGLAASRRKAERARARIMDRTRPLIIAGHRAGMTVIELAAITKLSRRAIYDIVDPPSGD